MSLFKISEERLNRKYYVIIVGFIIIFTICLTSKMFLFDDDQIMQTELNRPITTLEHTTVVLKKWEYDPNKSLMHVQIKTEKKGSFLESKLNFSAKVKSKRTLLPVDVVFHQDGSYVVQIQNVPKDYKVVGLFISEDADSSLLEKANFDTTKESNSTVKQNEKEKKIRLLGDYRKVKENVNLKKKEANEYVEDEIQDELQLITVEIENLQKSIPLQDGIVSKLEDEIKKLEANKEYQTKAQQQETDNEIQQRKGIIQQTIKQKEEMEAKLKEAEEKKKRTEKKLEDKRNEFQKMNEDLQ